MVSTEQSQTLNPSDPHALKITLPVEGMTCAACQANVQRALTAAPGVTKAAVNLMMHEATVHYDPSATSPGKLVEAINDTGYVSRIPAADVSSTTADDDRERSQARARTSTSKPSS
jgi:Cu+-exporting ATPase